MKVFISSTYVDLIDYRQAAIDAVLESEHTPVAMEHFLSMTKDPGEVCTDKIKECDIFVGIYAHRFGWVPEGQTKSITQQEYELAKKEKKPCLCFIVDSDFPWKPKNIEVKKLDELKAFLDVIKDKEVISKFKDVNDFKAKLSGSLGKLNAELTGTGETTVDGTCGIPSAPLPYMAHPYPLPAHFTGRDAERALLGNWFHNEKQPVLVMEAIGGMGKSALSWVWLQNDIIDRNVNPDGVFWWSFYEQPFEDFIYKLACYVLGKTENSGAVTDYELSDMMAALHHRRFLLVLDGLERALFGYGGMEAMFLQEKRFAGETEQQWEERQRWPINPIAGKFLRYLSVGRSKTLITTRLMPAPLDHMAGVKRVCLTGLSDADAVAFFKNQGIQGTWAEMVRAARVYDFHPLMLRLLALAVLRGRAKDIKDAFDMNIIDKARPHKILERSFAVLSEEEKQVAASVSVFRGGFEFEPARALFPEMKEDRLWEIMMELRGLGVLFYDKAEKRFDYHPILRAFLYDGLSVRDEVHGRAVAYFKALPPVKKVVTLSDLAPVIEHYHHLVKAGQFDEARVLYRDRLSSPLYFQLSAYQLQIDLLTELFPGGEDRPPRLTDESAQAWTLNELANSYSLSGRPARAVPLFLMQNELQEKRDSKINLAAGLGNVADAQTVIAQLTAAAAHLRKQVSLCREIKEEFKEAVAHQELGLTAALRGRAAEAEKELNLAFELAGRVNHIQNQGLTLAYRSLSALPQARRAATAGRTGDVNALCPKALAAARQALEFAEKDAKSVSPLPRDFVRSYWLLGAALGECGRAGVKIKAFDIPFYDEPFQQVTDNLSAGPGNEWDAADRCLREALRRCRKSNMVLDEPDILTALARPAWYRSGAVEAAEPLLKEAEEICLRAGYRTHLADVHLLCGEILTAGGAPQTLLQRTAAEHLTLAKDYARDVSELSHLHPSPDPHFYDGIPEYEMLKRGMTEEERIKNGYYVAYQIAEELEKKLRG